MPQAALEAMLADAIHPQRVHLRNLPASQDHPYVLRRLRETIQETRREGMHLWDITQSPTPRTHTPSPTRKRQDTDTSSTHSTPGAPRATKHNTRDPPASGATTQPRYPASHRRGTSRRSQSRENQANWKPIDADTQANGKCYAQGRQTQARSRRNRLRRNNSPAPAKTS